MIDFIKPLFSKRNAPKVTVNNSADVDVSVRVVSDDEIVIDIRPRPANKFLRGGGSYVPLPDGNRIPVTMGARR